MANLPSATTSLDTSAGPQAVGTDILVVMFPASLNADCVPRLFVSAAAMLAFHGYCAGVDYAALHFERTGKPVLACALPIVTAGVVSQQDTSGVDGSSVISVSGTPVDESDLILVVTSGGTIGTDQIAFDLSLDGGRTYQPVRLGTANSYAVPNLGITLAFAAGDLDVDDTFTARTSGPLPDAAGILAARTALAAQTAVSERSWLCTWECSDADAVDDVLTQVNAYETANDRFKTVRVAARDRRPAAKKSDLGTLTFAEVGLTGDTITRTSGSWIADGFKVGDLITVTGSASNNFAAAEITGVTATVLTLDDQDLEAEVAASATAVDVVAAAESITEWKTAIAGEYEDVSGARVDIAAGRARVLSPITGRRARRPASWFASLREFQRDVHIATWRKADGPLPGVDLEDEDGVLAEYDERVHGGLLQARFTTLRTWANGPNGVFVAQSLTRANPGSVLSRTHNMAVVNVAMTVCQAEAENAIGQVLVLRRDGSGKATPASLRLIEARVNSALAINLLQASVEGTPRASAAVWTASQDDDLSVPDAVLRGSLALELNNTVEHIDTLVRVNSAA